MTTAAIAISVPPDTITPIACRRATHSANGQNVARTALLNRSIKRPSAIHQMPSARAIVTVAFTQKGFVRRPPIHSRTAGKSPFAATTIEAGQPNRMIVSGRYQISNGG
jgi:hypothetical protein